jgi:hydroxymethylpyrimidine/phosphomethylpyrimidine kinase / thiaminase
MLVAKGSSFSAMKPAAQTIMNVVTESAMHKSFCAQWGISDEELESTPESPATTAYGAFLLDIAIEGIWPRKSSPQYCLNTPQLRR